MSETRCTCGRGCATFGECMRRKNIRVGYCKSHLGQDKTRQDQADRELELYRAARRQGVQPEGTHTDQIRYALDSSDATGEPYGAHYHQEA